MTASRPNLRLLRARSHRATLLLDLEYGSPNHGNKKNPLDELVFIILSLMTTHRSFNRVYTALRKKIKSWDKLLSIDIRVLRSTIKDGGLSYQKAVHLIKIMKRLQSDFGKVSLASLRKMNDAEIQSYLTSLPGVGIKSAKCIMMYSLDRDVLPVDTHVWRVARRLGLIGRTTTYSTVHDELEKVVAPKDRYAFHVNAISHGRSVCIALNPRCTSCCLSKICPFPLKKGLF